MGRRETEKERVGERKISERKGEYRKRVGERRYTVDIQ